MYLNIYICHPHIEEGQTKPVCFMKKKISLMKKNLINLRFMFFAVTVELHYNGNYLKSQISPIFLGETDFFVHKTDWFSLVLLYMWMTYELI